MGQGDGQALLRIARSGDAGAGLFSGGQSFSAPGLNGLLAGVGGAASQPQPSAQAAAPQPAASETFSFTCPAGDRHSVPVSYGDPTCGGAMKNLAKVYACNLIGDFGAAGQRCQQACGHPQCAEVR